MEVVSNNYMPGDPRLVQQLVYELKSQGIFDQFRKECISDVDTKPAYQNLRQRVEGSVTSFLKQQTWRPDMNKNQVREQLRKSIYESGYLETGVERIVDQVVNPKINTVFLPQVEDVVYRYLGIQKPNRMEIKKELKIDVTDLLPTDLEAVSPESDHTKEDSFNLNDSLNTDSKLEEDESPPFEPLDVPVQQNDVQHEENSVESHLSGFSGLQSHDSNPCNETKICPMELSNQDSQVSHNSSESHLSIITSEENTKMEVCEESESKLHKPIDSEERIEISVEPQTNSDKDPFQKDVEEIKKTEKTEPERKEEKMIDEKKSEDKKVIDKKNDDKKSEDKKVTDKKNEDRKATDKKNDDKKSEEKKFEDKKYNERKSDDKKSRSSEKHSSKDRKDDKYKKSSSSNSSSSRDKDKTSSRHSSSASSKDKDKSKERKESKTNISNNKDKEKVEKEKEKPEKDRSEKEKSKSEKDRERGDRDKSKSSSSSSSKYSNNKDKDKSHSSSKKESSGKDKDKSRSSSSSTSRESKSKSSHSESKSKSSIDKHRKDEKSSHNGKHSSSSSSLKKDKDKKRDSKKESKDDHYSSKEKKNDRRSTDRDSNDGQSSRQSQSNSYTESSSNTQKNSQESSNSNSGSGSGDSGNSDQIEHRKVISPVKLSIAIENKEVASTCIDIQKFKYIKPKFASNFEEARKLMKIRKQLAKLERQNQLSLTQIEIPVEMPTINGITYPEPNIPGEVDQVESFNKKPQSPERKEFKNSPKDLTPMLQSTELSKENWEALEARLAQEMSNINYNSYESPYDYDYDYAGYNSIVISPRKNMVVDDQCIVKEEKTDKTLEPSKSPILDFEKKDEAAPKKSGNISTESPKSPKKEIIFKKDQKNDVEKNRKLRVELETSIYKTSKGIVTVIEREEKNTKNRDKHKANLTEVENVVEGNKFCNKKKNISDHDTIHKHEENCENISDTDYECRYLEAPNPSVENNLQFIRRYIKKLESEVEHSVKAIQNNFLPLQRVGCKRKLEENVDFKNNNKAHYEQTTETKKRRRSIAPNPNSVIAQANREKVCNSTDISPNDSFSLPLSPAESDKSNDKKEDESPKLTKQKRNVIGRNTSTRSQRYSSDDLYKPRPLIIASTRRSRSAKNPGN